MALAAKSFVSGASVRSGRRQARRAPRAVAAKAKYGDESVFFDLNDVESTTGSWDVYGVDAESKTRYPKMQSKFWENATMGLTRRESMYSFIALSGAGALLTWGAKGSKDAKLPIQNGPQAPAALGPRGKK